MKETTEKSLCTEDIKLIALIRETAYGEITVKLRAGKPVMVEKGIQLIKLEEGTSSH